MTTYLLTCQLSNTAQATIQQWVKENVAGVTVLPVPDVQAISNYLHLRPPYEQRECPAPHLLLIGHARGQEDKLKELFTLKNRESGRKLPILIWSENLTQDQVNQLYQQPMSAILMGPDAVMERDEEAIFNSLTYWLKVVKLPML